MAAQRAWECQVPKEPFVVVTDPRAKQLAKRVGSTKAKVENEFHEPKPSGPSLLQMAPTETMTKAARQGLPSGQVQVLTCQE